MCKKKGDVSMKKTVLIILLICFALLSGCKSYESVEVYETPEEVITALEKGNTEYVSSGKNSGNVSAERRTDTAENGQFPYAVVVTCSDSRVPPEHIFGAGIGELFVIRTAGNVIGDFELGSIEYGAEHLHSKLVVVLGHTNCGAVDAALSGGAHGYIEKITDEINSCVPSGTDPREAEKINVENSISAIRKSEIMQELEHEGAVKIVGAIYDISTGKVEFLG